MAKAKTEDNIEEAKKAPKSKSTSKTKISKEAKKIEELTEELEISKDKHIRLYSEFENFRRRTAKEKLEMISTANESLIGSLLSVLDDFERADKAFNKDTDVKAMKEGVDLVFNKLKNVLEQKGTKKMELEAGSDFDPDFHEAITQIPAPKKELKGKIVDVIENGYMLGEKVVRFAKVVTGA
jgi:molecular chaperone GrpE